MSTLTLRRLRFCREADTWLKVLKSRTGVTPNILCRIGYCLSLDEPGIPSPEKYAEDSDREINRYTLLGEHDFIYVSLLRQRMSEDGSSEDASIDDYFRAHMNRGVILLAGRAKSLGELLSELSRLRPD
jgi:DNA sulfur modification protein DndE